MFNTREEKGLIDESVRVKMALTDGRMQIDLTMGQSRNESREICLNRDPGSNVRCSIELATDASEKSNRRGIRPKTRMNSRPAGTSKRCIVPP
jgi:hypothetical protein